MTLSPTRVSTTGIRRLTTTLYGYAFLDDFVLLYPVYALLFADTGMSLWQISSLFALWSITAVVLEVPSGALADAVSRRLLLWIGPLFNAVGFALWVIVPAYWAFALGFVLWGVGGALCSGSFEALAYDELDRLGAADRYARVMGRVRAARLVATMAAIGLAGPVFALGGYPMVGAGSVLACLLAAAVATRLPEHRTQPETGGDGWWTTLRTGLAVVRKDRSVRGALLLVPAVAAVWGALDEYTPLLARDTGVAETTVPYLILLVWTLVTAASLLTGPAERLSTTGTAWLLAGSALALAAGASSGTPAGIALVGLAFGGFQLAEVLADVRLQHRIDESRRATLTSVASLGTELVTVATFGAYALLGTTAAHSTVFAVLAVPYLVTALVLARSRAATARP
ncbi:MULTISPECIES: MFS transporter [unclassified Streptomyces]|uniref:MFS transporter n=1 Tax=unclassified Streptomyces TaxID=2593676 RepID=UPI002255A256|nr:MULTISPECIES: MFS transporter [unclassified Streptomyces]MCX5337908.1 MFS transporter [Streptomyces sp. NBC_00140]MCX5365141.1 MFS transporter [Streptomyces sp. NBC_00124]